MLTIAKCSLQTLIMELCVAIRPYNGILKPIEGSVAQFDRQEFHELVIAGIDGEWSFILEPRGAEIAVMYDVLRRVSSATMSTVAAFVSDSGDLEFGKYEEGQPVRLLIDRPTAFSEPFSFGERLKGEPDVEGDKISEIVLNSILDQLGFSRFRFPDAYVASADDVQLGWKIDLMKFLLEAPQCAHGFDDHVRRFEVSQKFFAPKLHLRFGPDEE